jgi:hypothetical protein
MDEEGNKRGGVRRKMRIPLVNKVHESFLKGAAHDALAGDCVALHEQGRIISFPVSEV